MLDLPYYRLELDDYAAAAFTSFSKDYYGTLDDILRLMDALPVNRAVYVNGKRYLLSHAAPVEDYPLYSYRYESAREFAVWKRYRIGEYRSDNHTLIFGHTPTSYYQNVMPMEIWRGQKCIGIDCGCAYSYGRLACLRLEDGKVFCSEDVCEQI